MVVMIDLADWPHFFIGGVVGFAIGGAVGLAIDGAISMEIDIAVGFFELSLW